MLIGVALSGALMCGVPTRSWAKELLLKVGDLQVPVGTAVRGDAIALGGTAYVDGMVQGDVVAVGGNVEVSGHVTGSVRAEGGSVVLHATAVVDGEAAAVGGTVRREPGASVGGQRSAPLPPAVPPAPGPTSPGPDQVSPPPWWLPGAVAGVFLFLKSLFWLFHLAALVMFVGTAWLLAALFPRAIARLGAVVERDPVTALGAGLLGWPVAAMIAVLLVISVVGLTLALLIPLALFVAVQAGTTAVALVVGHRIHPSTVAHEALVGAVILAILFSIPGLGGLAALVVATWGLGAVLLVFVEHGRFRPSPPTPQSPSTQQSSGGTAAS